MTVLRYLSSGNCDISLFLHIAIWYTLQSERCGCITQEIYRACIVCMPRSGWCPVWSESRLWTVSWIYCIAEDRSYSVVELLLGWALKMRSPRKVCGGLGVSSELPSTLCFLPLTGMLLKRKANGDLRRNSFASCLMDAGEYCTIFLVPSGDYSPQNSVQPALVLATICHPRRRIVHHSTTGAVVPSWLAYL